MDNELIEAIRESRRMRAFAIIVILIIVLAILLFLWGTILNRGTLRIIGEAPFTVEIFDGETINCTLSPCEIKQKRGIKDLIIRKENYETLVLSATVKLWRTVDFPVQFKLTPQITKAENWPDDSDYVEYKLVLDTRNGMQKLIRADDDRGIPIVYFPDSLTEAKLIGSAGFVLAVSDEDIYKVNVQSKTRQKILAADFKGVTDGKWSLDGKYFAFTVEGSDYVWLLDNTDKTMKLNLAVTADQFAWTYDNSLIFVTDQAYKSEAGGVALLSEKSPDSFTFGFYYPDKNSYTRIETFSEISSMPTQLTTTASGNAVYFRSGEENFKIILEKF